MEREGRRRSFDPERIPFFTQRQLRLIQLCVNGVRSTRDLAHKMGISKDGVSSYKRDVTERLEDRGIRPATFRRAISESVWRGLIDTSELPDKTDMELTDVETNLVAFIAIGYCEAYICDRFSLTEESWRIDRKSLLMKLNVKNLNQVAAVGARELERARTASGSHV